MNRNENEFDTLPEEPECNAAGQPGEEASANENIGDGVIFTPEQMEQLEGLAEQAAKMEQQLKESSDQYLRLLAEYDNYRKRTQKEKEAIAGDEKAAAVLALLPIYDNLLRALAQETEDAAFYKGVEMTMSQCKAAFASLGAEEIPALGEPFDPALHNAVMHVEEGDRGENTIIEVFQSGFIMGDKVIRHAMVKVAN
jgi:molecular chaperone GrpE